MKAVFSLFIAALIISIVMVIFGIVFRKSLSPHCTACLIIGGIMIAAASIVMCFCLGFFMV